MLRSFLTYAAWFGKRSLLLCRNRIQRFFLRLGTSICNCLAAGRTTRPSGRIICDMTGKGKRLDASWTMARKLLASVSYRIATRRKRFNLEKNREGLEWVPVRRLLKIKRAANFGKTLITGRVAGLCRCRTPRKELHLDANLAAAHLPPTLA